MDGGKIVSSRGVYYDLTKSPYEFISPYGDIFKFSSKKKLEIYTRDIVKEVKRVDAIIMRNGLADYLPDNALTLIYASVYRAFYRKIER